MTTRLPIDFLCFAVGEENDRLQLKSFKSPPFLQMRFEDDKRRLL